MFNLKDLIGDRGEYVTVCRLTQAHLFMATVIGGKCPAFDILLEVNEESKPYFALVQVKTSENARYDASGGIKKSVPIKKMENLWKIPIPTYVAGADLANEVVFIAPAYKMKGAIYESSIPNTYVLSHANLAASKRNLEKLKEDIIFYWEKYNIPVYKNYYSSLL